MATEINIGGTAVNALSGTDVERASTCVAWSGAQCFWHSGLVGEPCMSGQCTPIEFIETAVIAVIWLVASGAA